MGISSINGQSNIAANFQVNAAKSKNATEAFLTTASSSSTGASAQATKPGVEVTLSQDALRLSSTKTPGWVQEQADKLRSNPNQEEAMLTVQQLATAPGGALLSYAPDSDGVTGVYYAATGTPVTPESKARFESISQSILSETSNIFYSERAKGTSAADIFEKMHQFMSTQPNDYLEATNWFRPSIDQATA